MFVPLDGGLEDAGTHFSWGLGESTVDAGGEELAGASYTYEPAPPMFTPTY